MLNDCFTRNNIQTLYCQRYIASVMQNIRPLFMSLLLGAFYLCPLAAHHRCICRELRYTSLRIVHVQRRRKRASFNATPHLDLPVPPRLPPVRRLRSTFSVTPTICLRSRGVKRIILWICIGPLLIHIHARVIHNGPLPLPTSDASALISSLLSRFARAFLRGTVEKEGARFKWLVDTVWQKHGYRGAGVTSFSM